MKPLRTGFEPVRVEPNGFQVHLLNHSDTAASRYVVKIVKTNKCVLTTLVFLV